MTERRDFMTGESLDPPKLTRLVSPKAKEMIAELRQRHPADEDFRNLLCDILDEMNEQEVYRR